MQKFLDLLVEKAWTTEAGELSALRGSCIIPSVILWRLCNQNVLVALNR